MRITIISGSHRKSSQSARIARIVNEALKRKKTETNMIDLAGNPLPLWDEEIWEDHSVRWEKVWSPISHTLRQSDGFVVVTPEWHGMVPSGLKNFFLLCGGKRDLAHKPAYIVAVSAGVGGSYPVAELRMSSYKNTRICYIPEQLIIRNCEKFMKDPEALTERDQKTLARMDYGLNLLLEYAKGMSDIREKMFNQEKNFPNGM